MLKLALIIALVFVSARAIAFEAELKNLENQAADLGVDVATSEVVEEEQQSSDVFAPPLVSDVSFDDAEETEPESRNTGLAGSPLPLSYVAFALLPLLVGGVLFVLLYRHFSAAPKGERLLSNAEPGSDVGFSTQQKVVLGAVLLVTLLVAVAVALAVALPGRVGAAPVAEAVVSSRAGGIEATWTAIARRMGGSVTRPRTLGKGCCCGRLGCNFGQMDVSGMCGRGARNVCASGTAPTRPGVLVHEVMHLYLWHVNRFRLTRRTMMDERFTDCLTKAVSGNLWTHYGCGGGLQEARNLLARYPPSQYPWGRR